MERHTRYHHARLLLAAGGGARRSEGQRLMEQAEGAATELGMTRLLRLIAEATSAPA